jgi:hypothetical protein
MLVGVEIKEGITIDSNEIMKAFKISKDILLKPFMDKGSELE